MEITLLDITFKSLKEASDYTGIPSGYIGDYIRGNFNKFGRVNRSYIRNEDGTITNIPWVEVKSNE